ncbi:MAG: alpha/beta hydrolase [Treponema sp.]|nr:alpha/beta hydrolase [Treponema sp.]
MKNIVIYIHGKGGNAGEGEHYKKFFPDTEIYGFDYKANTPLDAKDEFFEQVSELSKKYSSITLIAVSLGAYFSLVSGIDKFITKVYFISPIVNMESLIVNMIGWAGTTEAELEEKKIIPVDFGDDLSWEYLQYVRNNKISWTVPTEILYGNLDNLQSLETIQQFAKETGASVTVMEGGEHWFHTDEQMKFLDEWMTDLE